MKEKIKPYIEIARLDKPAGVVLLMIPCWIGVALSSSRSFFWFLFFSIGSLLSRAAGCIINDIVDQEIDKNVERTKNRPLARGEIKTKNALILLAFILFCGFLLFLILPMLSKIISVIFFIGVIVYPYCKRFIEWPQVVLGFLFSSGVIIAYSAIEGTITNYVICIYIGCIFWVIGYDTIYACQDVLCDEKIGLKSTAVYFKQDINKFLDRIYDIACGVWIVGFISLKFSFFPILILIIIWLLIKRRIVLIDFHNFDICKKEFYNNISLGFILFLLILFWKHS